MAEGTASIIQALGAAQADIQEMVFTAAILQIILGAIMLFIWYHYRKSDRLSIWVKALVAATSLISTGIIGIAVFIIVSGYYFYRKNLDWSLVFKRQAQIAGTIALIYGIVMLVMMLLIPWVIASLTVP